MLNPRPNLSILHAWNIFTSGKLDEANRSLQAAENILGYSTDQIPLEQGQISDPDKIKRIGMVVAIRSFLASYSGDISRAFLYPRKAIDYLPKQELP